MVDKPSGGVVSSGRDRPVAEAAYFFLRGFAFFFTISAWVLGGMASIRRASSSTEIGGDSPLRFAVMGVSRG